MEPIADGARSEPIERTAPAPPAPGTVALAVAALLSGILVTWGLFASPAGRDGLRVKPEVPVTPMDEGLGAARNSPALAQDPTEARFVVMANRLDAPDFSCELQVSGDGGRGWRSIDPVPELPPGAEKCYSPEVAFGPDGTLYYLFVGLAGRGNEPIGAFLTTSIDRGRTFSQPQQVLGPLNFGVRMAIDTRTGPSGRMHLAWLHATSDPPLGGFGPPPNPIMTAYSDDGGKTFSRGVQVSDPGRQRVVAPSLAVGPNESVHIGYLDLQSDVRDYQGLEGPVWEGRWSLVLATSWNGGESYMAGSVVDEVVPPERVTLVFTMPPPSIAADETNVCVSWSDGRHGDSDALIRCSRNGSGAWEETRRLNTDSVGNGSSQYLPRLAFSPGGRLDAIFYDRRRDVDDIRADVYHTFSEDGGRSFGPNLKLTQRSSSSLIGQQYSHPSAEGKADFGSRLGLLSNDGAVIAAWTDTRNSTAGTGQDLFAAELGAASTNLLSRTVRWGGTGLLAAGAVLITARHRRRRGAGAPFHSVPHRRSSPDRGPHLSPQALTRRNGLVVALSVAFLMVGWWWVQPRQAATLPTSPPVISINVYDHGFKYDKQIPPGRVVFRFLSTGEVDHSPALIPLAEDVPPINEQLHGSVRRTVAPFAGIPTLRPGEQGTFAVDLAPGHRYALVDFAQGPDGRILALQGGSSEFRTAGPRTTVVDEPLAPSPSSTEVIKLKDCTRRTDGC